MLYHMFRLFLIGSPLPWFFLEKKNLRREINNKCRIGGKNSNMKILCVPWEYALLPTRAWVLDLLPSFRKSGF